MVAIAIVYEGSLRCRASHGPSEAVLLTDAPKDNQGNGASFSPTDLVGTALGTCILTTMGIVARRLGVVIDGAKAEVVKEMMVSPERRIGALRVVVELPAGGITDEQKQALERAGLNCPVHKSLHPGIAMPVEFRWVGD